jgi:hypothetical protein
MADNPDLAGFDAIRRCSNPASHRQLRPLLRFCVYEEMVNVLTGMGGQTC